LAASATQWRSLEILGLCPSHAEAVSYAEQAESVEGVSGMGRGQPLVSRTRRAAIRHEARQIHALGRTKGWTVDQIQDELLRRFHDELAPGEARMHAHGWGVSLVREGLQTLAASEGLDASGLQDADVLRWLRGEIYPRDSLDRLCRLFQCHQDRLGWPVVGLVSAVDYTPGRPSSPMLSPIADGEVDEERSFRARVRDRSIEVGAAAGDAPLTSSAFPFDTPVDIALRMRRLAAVNVDDGTLDVLDLAVHEITGRYEGEGPQRLAREVIGLRHLVEGMLGGHQHPDERRRLYELAGRFSALLAYMAVNCGRFSLAVAYCEEALNLAVKLDDSDLQAWVRGTQSLAAYYMGRFDDALELAQAGQHAAKGGPQAIRLAVNGEARALGRLGDRRGVDEAVDRAFQLADVVPIPAGLTPCISFEPYSVARIAANAATAYLSVGDAQRALQHADQVDTLVEASDSVWSRSLVRLDKAAALLRQDRPDVEQAMQLGGEALIASADRPIRSVWQRAHELHAEVVPWHRMRAVREYGEALRGWRARPASRVAAGTLAATEPGR
jgi:tetratricopeptide (TPR) repeat protein